MLDCFLHFEPVGASDHLVHLAETQLGHEFADLLRNHAHEINHVFGLAGKKFAQFRILRGLRQPGMC